MATERIKDLKDLQLLLQATKPSAESAVEEAEQTPIECCEEFDQEDYDFSDEEIRATRRKLSKKLIRHIPVKYGHRYSVASSHFVMDIPDTLPTALAVHLCFEAVFDLDRPFDGTHA